MYSSEKNVQILLALLKAHGIRKMVLSPGSANASFVASAQYDSCFELYSSVDERSAAYIACGLAEEATEPVVICCTGATASRNYMPGLTEAYYRKLPIIAITATRPIAWIGQNRDQLIDRTVVPKDVVVKSVYLPIVENEEDEWECNLKVNDALLELKRNGKGPVHINLTTSYSLDFSIEKLPLERTIHRYGSDDKMPRFGDNCSVGIFVGAHTQWSDRLLNSVEVFCKKYDAVVLYDQTSNYRGKYGILCGMFNISGFPNIKMDYIIHLGNISAAWPIASNEVWRVNPDGEIRDTYRKLTNVFEMDEEKFFEYYNQIKNISSNGYYEKWSNEYDVLLKSIESYNTDMKFSSLWIAQNIHDKMPTDSVIHFGILNTLRCWNCYKLDNSIRGYSNTGGFGIDGGVSSLIGASFCDSKKLYFGIFGDLAFFYDMNSLGNRHIRSNVRIMIVNNGLGGEFKNTLGNVQKAGLGESANDYIAAYGHYGRKSPDLLKHYSEDLGFQYLFAYDKESFIKNINVFLSHDSMDKPILFEVFLDERDDVSAISLLQGIRSSNSVKQKMKDVTKKFAKNILKL